MSWHHRWRDLFRRTPTIAPWEGRRAFEFDGIFYAANDEEERNILHAIADAVCPNGGTVVSKPAKEDEGDEVESA